MSAAARRASDAPVSAGRRVPHQRGPAGGRHPLAAGAGGAARGAGGSLAAQPACVARVTAARARAAPRARPRARARRLLRPAAAVPGRHGVLAAASECAVRCTCDV